MKLKLHYHHPIRQTRRLERRGIRGAISPHQTLPRSRRISISFSEEALENLEDVFGVSNRFITPDLAETL